MKEKINERKRRGRPRKTFIKEMIGMTSCNGYSHMKTSNKERKVEVYFYAMTRFSL